MTGATHARFWKADLQVQTPADHQRWQGSSKVVASTTPGERARIADTYIARCYEVGLEIVGVTDHNLSPTPGFVDDLRSAIARAAPTHGYELVLFPGFEIDVNVGMGFHALCLFEPETSVATMDSKLSALGLEHGKRFDGKGDPLGMSADEPIRKLLDVVQGDHRGIVVLAHASSDSGALDTKSIPPKLRAEVANNGAILCMEQAHPRSQLLAKRDSWMAKLLRCDPAVTTRTHEIAVINSSDAKALHPDDHPQGTNYIGFRHTWLKMGSPTIEGLRQAFLDHGSRIRFGAARPEDLLTHPRIEQITISGATFLADQTIVLPPNLTTFIGGGGTGKSTILEYVRAALGRPPTGARDVLDNRNRALDSLGSGSVTLHLRTGDNRYETTFSRTSTADALDHRFPVVAFSQREVFAIADSGEATLSLLDQLQRETIDELVREEQRAAAALQSLDNDLAQLPALQRQLAEVTAEVARLRDLLQVHEQQQAPLAHLNLLRREAAAVEAIDAGLVSAVQRIDGLADDLALGVGRSGFRNPDTPNADEVDDLLGRAREAVAGSTRALQQAAAALAAAARAEAGREERGRWAAALSAAEATYAAVTTSQAIEASPGARPEQLRQQLILRESEHRAITEQVRGLESRAQTRAALLGSLRAVWRRQVDARRSVATSLRDLVPPTTEQTPSVEVEIRPFADVTALCARLNKYVHGGRLNRQEAEQLCALAAEAAGDGSPAATVVAWARELAGGGEVPPLAVMREAVRTGLATDLTDEVLAELERLRLPDVVDVVLRRPDGSTAGSFLQRDLSVGQQCTAIIAIALATGDDPILIDQPEDEIDNEFIYTELVPLLRRSKDQRQVITTTHNPNLPVNGDAELIYALEARQTTAGGRVRGARRSAGSLDDLSVKEAVESIMEGSREAFERRQVRYGF
ncbi:MAG: AAA family ATPase [Acidimicrobiales bacterium]